MLKLWLLGRGARLLQSCCLVVLQERQRAENRKKTIVMIIITVLKGAVGDFFSAPRTVFNMYAEVYKSCANHMQHIGHLSCASCSVPLGTKGRLSY